jgi:polysaccharide biosynthesis/export protein
MNVPARVVLCVAVAALVCSVVGPARAAQGSGAQAASAPSTQVAPVAEEHLNYRIGPGDVLEIRVLGEDQMSTPAVRVSNEGFIRAPFVDEDLHAECMTERELSALIADKLKKYLKYPEVHVSVKEFNSTPVAIMGAVNTPSRFQMQHRVRLIELLTYAGGPRNDAGKVLNVIHTMPEQTCDVTAAAHTEDATEVVSLSKLMSGDLTQDRLLRPGDIVILPTADLVFVAGEVLKPNAYPLREGLTLTQVVALAGGPTNVAKTSAIRIVRQEPGKPRQEIPIDLKAIQTNKTPDPVLMANDVIEVPDSSGKRFMRGFLGAISGGAASLPTRVIP